jgi:hypothetical protein
MVEELQKAFAIHRKMEQDAVEMKYLDPTDSGKRNPLLVDLRQLKSFDICEAIFFSVSTQCALSFHIRPGQPYQPHPPPILPTSYLLSMKSLPMKYRFNYCSELVWFLFRVRLLVR